MRRVHVSEAVFVLGFAQHCDNEGAPQEHEAAKHVHCGRLVKLSSRMTDSQLGLGKVLRYKNLNYKYITMVREK